MPGSIGSPTRKVVLVRNLTGWRWRSGGCYGRLAARRAGGEDRGGGGGGLAGAAGGSPEAAAGAAWLAPAWSPPSVFLWGLAWGLHPARETAWGGPWWPQALA